MNFLADESVDRQIVDALREDGHAVLYVTEMDAGISDDEFLDKAEKESAILLLTSKKKRAMAKRAFDLICDQASA